MRLTDKILEVVGADKLLHFLSAMCVALIALGIGSTWFAVVAIVALVALSVVKEVKWDDAPDWYDVVSAVAGVAVALIVKAVLW